MTNRLTLNDIGFKMAEIYDIKPNERKKKTKQHAICFVLYSWFQFGFRKAATGVRLGVYSETLHIRKHLN